MSIKTFFYELKRIIHEIVWSIILISSYIFKIYSVAPPELQQVIQVSLLASLGFTHAHITRKMVFPKVDWDNEPLNPKTALVISLYFAFIYAYSHGVLK